MNNSSDTDIRCSLTRTSRHQSSTTMHPLTEMPQIPQPTARYNAPELPQIPLLTGRQNARSIRRYGPGSDSIAGLEGEDKQESKGKRESKEKGESQARANGHQFTKGVMATLALGMVGGSIIGVFSTIAAFAQHPAPLATLQQRQIMDASLPQADTTDSAIEKIRSRQRITSLTDQCIGSILPGGNVQLRAPVRKMSSWSTVCHRGADPASVQGINQSGTVRVNDLASLEANLNNIANGMEILAVAWGGSTIIIGISTVSGLGFGALRAAGERRAARESHELKSAAVTDHLTGLGNRRASDAALRKEFERSTQTGKPISIIYGDLDGFKRVNDHLGHDVGDRVLVEVGRRLHEQVRYFGYAARSGGDEFTVVLPETDQATAQALADRLEHAIRLEVGDDVSLPVSISLGVATRRQDERCLADLQRRADQEMYHNKKARKSQVHQLAEVVGYL